jgi:hypothetical protein
MRASDEAARALKARKRHKASDTRSEECQPEHGSDMGAITVTDTDVRLGKMAQPEPSGSRVIGASASGSKSAPIPVVLRDMDQQPVSDGQVTWAGEPTPNGNINVVRAALGYQHNLCLDTCLLLIRMILLG